MAKDIAIIQVCFNLLDPYQRNLHERVSSFPNRSGYIKRLIQWDLDKQEGAAIATPHRAYTGLIDDFNAEGFI